MALSSEFGFSFWPEAGLWPFTALEPGSVVSHERNAQNQITRYSQMRYWCDKFPPATWVEGGNGCYGTTPASTFYAGIACIAPSHPPTVSDFDLVGYITELPAGRTLDATGVLPNDNMTLEMCASYCAA